MERALLNLRAARSTDPPRGGIDFVVEFMGSSFVRCAARCHRARARFAVVRLPRKR